jgi:restriction endonuclease S subunit
MIDNLHVNFNAFVQRAKDYVDERDTNLRHRERNLCVRESYIDNLEKTLKEKGKILDSTLQDYKNLIQINEEKIESFESEHLRTMEEMEVTFDQRLIELNKQRDAFEKERENFHDELQVICGNLTRNIRLIKIKVWESNGLLTIISRYDVNSETKTSNKTATP